MPERGLESGFSLGEGVGVVEVEEVEVGVADAVLSEMLTEEVAAAETWKCDVSLGLITEEDTAACC